MKKLKLILTAFALLLGWNGAWAETDVTSTYLTNADFSNDGTGWTGIGSDKSKAFIIANNTTFEGSNDKNAEMWIGQNKKLGSGDLNQTISSLPAGVYRLTAKVRSDVKFDLYATIGGVEQHIYSETAIGVTEMSLLFVVNKTSSVKVGLKHSGVSINTYNWIAVDDFKLYSEGEIGSSVDVTTQIVNWHFTGCENNDFPGWTISNPNNGNAWKNGDTRVEYWIGSAKNGSFDYYQTLTGLPSGKYTLSASMWNDTNNETGASFDGGGTCGVYGTSTNGSVFAGVTVNSSDCNTYTTDEIAVTDGNLRLGVKNNTTMTARWFGVDLIKLNYDPYISVVATDFTSGSEMTAGQWYKFTVDAAGDYGFDNISGVIITTNGSQALSEATGDALTHTKALSTGTTYYIKSTTAQTVTKSGPFTYTIGSGTSDKSYIQAGNTVTISYADMATTNAYASELSTEITGVTFGGNAISVSRTTHGFTFTVPAVSAGTDYTLSIPAGVIGYDAPGSGTNAAQNITLKTPVVFNGTYYLYSPVFDQFLSRGSWWGTRAVVDIYGTPVTLTTDADNLTTIMMVDNSGYIKDSEWLYTDGGIDKANHFVIQNSTVEGYEGYQFKTYELEGTKYLYVNSDASDAGSDSHGVAGNSIMGENITDWNQTVWQLMSLSDHDTRVNAYPTANKTSVITASGISTTVGDFETFLSTNYYAKDKSSLITPVSSGNAKGTGWAWNPTARTKDGFPAYEDPYASLSLNTGYYTYTISSSNLPAGIYKVQISGFDRRKGQNDEQALYTEYGNIGASYLKVNNQQVRIMSSEEMFGIEYSGNRSWAYQLDYLNAGKAINVVYVYLDGSTDMTLKVEKPDYNSAGSCLVFGDFKLTYYDANLSQSISVAGWATLYTPNALDFSGVEGLTAYTATLEGSTVNLTEVNDVPANTGVVLKGAKGTYSIPVITSSYTDKGSLEGNATEATAYDAFTGKTLYILALNDKNEAQFFPTSGGSIAAGKAYLPVPSGSAKALRVVVNGQATEVIAPEIAATEEEEEVLYNMAGVRVDKNFKGFVINQKGEKRFNR